MKSDVHQNLYNNSEFSHAGSDSARQMLPIVYDQLHAIAEQYLHRERVGHTLQPTALIHEVFLRLSEQDKVVWHDRSHFLLIAARAMRQILVNHAIHRNAQKRGGDWREIALEGAITLFEERSIDLIALNEALEKLQALDAQQARLVELRFFAGLSTDAAAEALGMSVRTVEREWAMARAWLRRELDAEEPRRPN